MKINRRAIQVLLAALVSILLLAACGGDEPADTEESPTTGNAEAFEIEGTVQAVEVEEDEGSPSPGASPTAETPATSAEEPRARLLVEVESINEQTAELCDVSEGDEVTLIITQSTAFDQDQEPDDLSDLEDQSIRAEGNAEELATGDEEEATGTATPTAGASPTAGGGTEDPEAGCNFEVAQLSIVEDEGDGGTGVGTSTSSPTPAPAGGGDVPGGTPTPTNERSPSPTGASPTSGGAGM